MVAEYSRKHLRAPSDEIESMLFPGEVNPVEVLSSKRVRITITKHKKGGWASAAKPSYNYIE